MYCKIEYKPKRLLINIKEHQFWWHPVMFLEITSITYHETIPNDGVKGLYCRGKWIVDNKVWDIIERHRSRDYWLWFDESIESTIERFSKVDTAWNLIIYTN